MSVRPAVSLADGARVRLEEFRRAADRRLEEIFRAREDAVCAEGGPPSPRDLVRAIRDFTLRGGKRLRPALAFHAARCFDGSLDEETLLDASLSLDLLQTCLLIQDDWMDGDEIRRGGPAVHASFSKSTGSSHLGAALAMLAGDLAGAHAMDCLTMARLPADRRLAAVQELVRAWHEVVLGQQLDLVGGVPLALVQDLKTASYTTRGPVRLGAALGGAPPEDVDRLTRYATPLGIAFQIRDDILGTFGDERVTGKPVGRDLGLGRANALVDELLRIEGDRGAAEIERMRAAGDLEGARELIRRTGALAHCERKVRGLTEQAVVALEGVAYREEGARFLLGVAHWLASRER